MAQIMPLKRCPECTPVQIEQHWYRLPSARTLGICSRCYLDHLSTTPFSSYFELEYDLSGTSRFCDFNFPRMLAVLRQALEQNNFLILQDYIIARSQIQRCRGGGVAATAEEGFSWFQVADPNLAGQFGTCRACYEDYIIAAGFSHYFGGTPVYQPKGQLWECDLGWQFSKRLAKSSNDWNQVLTYGLRRKRLPKCTRGVEADAESRSWFKIRASDLGSLWMCEACFYDFAFMTVMEQHLYQPPQPPHSTRLKCFVNGSVPLRIAWEEALTREDFNIFYRAAQVVVRSPPCTPNGIQNGIWYSLNPPCEDFDACAACYAGILEANGVGHFLARKWTQPGQVRVCDLNLAMPRAKSYLQKLDLAIERDDASFFTDFIRRISQAPPCPKGELVTNRRWYRHDMFSCCPSCWIEVVEGTPLVSCFLARNEQFPTQLKCDFYSSRVRGLLQEACANNDLPGFLAFMKRRLEIWQQTYPQIQHYLASMRRNTRTQAALFVSSTILTDANAIASAWVTGNFGNSQIGYGYNTPAGAQGAIRLNQALGINGANANIATTIVQLELLWKSVE